MLDLCKTNWMLGRKTDEMLGMLPLMEDQNSMAAMAILRRLTHASFRIQPQLAVLITLRMVQLTLQHGVTAASSLGFAMHGFYLCGVFGKRKEGYRFGRIALYVLERFQSKELLSQVFLAVYGFTNHWSKHLHLSLEPLQHAHSIGMKIDIEYGYLCKSFYFMHAYLGGRPLESLLGEMMALSKQRKEFLGVVPIDAYTQAVMNLLGQSEEPTMLKGEAFDQDVALQKFGGIPLFRFTICFHRMILTYLFGMYETASEMAEESRPLITAVTSMHSACVHVYYDGLISLAMARKSKATKWRKIAKQCIAKMGEYASDSPQNCQHKLRLLQAELAYLDGRHEGALLAYDDAVCLAHKEKFLNDEALIHERKGIFYLETDHNILATNCFSSSSQVYLEWGAVSKVKHLRQSYPNLFKDIKRRSSSLGSSTSFLASMATSSDIEGEELDLHSVMKSSTSLSAEIKLPNLLKSLMGIVMENAGAQKGFLLLAENEDNDLYVQASRSIFEDEATVLQRIPLHLADEVARTIIQYVSRTQNHVVLEDGKEKNRFSKDPHIEKYGPRSVLCIPIINRGKVIGVLYMENNSGTNVFTHNRVALLALLTGQIAISIENAMLYENLEQKVSDRTKELKEERDQSERLLLNILPKETAEELKENDKIKPKYFDEVSVLFTDFKGFTKISMELTVEEMVGELDACFSAFDAITEKYCVEKIKTIGGKIEKLE